MYAKCEQGYKLNKIKKQIHGTLVTYASLKRVSLYRNIVIPAKTCNNIHVTVVTSYSVLREQ